MNKTIACLAIFIGVLTLMGCTSADKLRNDVIQTQNSSSTQKTTESRAKVIADHLLQLNEVEDCAVHISGDTAVVSISLTCCLERRELIALKKKIIAETKAIDPQIVRTAVSTSAELYKRLDALRPDTQEDKKVQEELEENSTNMPTIVIPSF